MLRPSFGVAFLFRNIFIAVFVTKVVKFTTSTTPVNTRILKIMLKKCNFFLLITDKCIYLHIQKR